MEDRRSHGYQPRAIGGALACLGAAASYGLSYVYMGRQLAGRGLSPLVLPAAQLTAATGLLLLVTPVAGLQPVQLTRRSWRQSASLARWAPARPMS